MAGGAAGLRAASTVTGGGPALGFGGKKSWLLSPSYLL